MLLVLALDLVLRGTVVDPSGLAVAHALVYVDGTQLSTETDSGGRFELRIDAPRAGTLVVYRDGFAAAASAFDPIDPGTLEPVRIVLETAPISEVVTVAAPRAPPTPPSTFTMRPLDVVRTPGSAADLMRALQTLPGVAQIDDGAGLYVRGGDASEVLVLLDDAVVVHPYRAETPGGGLFGTVEPFLLEGASFATGGFSARYGNALSAVLDLHGLARPEAPQANVTFGLAGASFRSALPLGAHGGVRASGNRSFPGLLFAVNGRPYEFHPLPGGWNVDASAHYDSAGAGRFKGFVNAAGDGVGVHVDSVSFGGLLTSSTRSNLAALHWTDVVDGVWLATATVSVTDYARQTSAGVLALTTTDRRASWRASVERALGSWTLRLGGDRIDARTDLDGTVPARGGDLGGIAGTTAIGVRYDAAASGAYVETERRVAAATVTLGARAQDFSLARETSLDPRAHVAIDVAPHQRVSVAWGVYRQAPDAAYYSHVGSDGLQAMRATHSIVGYEYGGEREPLHLRAEAYWKRYDALPLENAGGLFVSTGYGSAHGLDLFAHVKRRRLDLVADYSWLAAARRWTAVLDRGKFTTLPAGTWRPDFDIPHTAHVMTRVDLTQTLSASAGWRVSSGTLDTPIVGAAATPSGFVPIYGAINSERLPRDERTDLTFTYLSPLLHSRGVLFASIGNLFARTNYFEYVYSADFSTRRPVTSATPRVVYAGITLTK